MALISINDPGVFADVYQYHHLEDEQMNLDMEKRALHTFSQWYYNNNDTLDFTPYMDDHRKAAKLLLSFITLHQKKADKYNLCVKHFANKVCKIEGRLINAKVMQRIFNHNMHVWMAIQGTGAENSYWGSEKPKPPLTPGKCKLPILPLS
jgi:hypothetical protein